MRAAKEQPLTPIPSPATSPTLSLTAIHHSSVPSNIGESEPISASSGSERAGSGLGLVGSGHKGTDGGSKGAAGAAGAAAGAAGAAGAAAGATPGATPGAFTSTDSHIRAAASAAGTNANTMHTSHHPGSDGTREGTDLDQFTTVDLGSYPNSPGLIDPDAPIAHRAPVPAAADAALGRATATATDVFDSVRPDNRTAIRPSAEEPVIEEYIGSISLNRSTNRSLNRSGDGMEEGVISEGGSGGRGMAWQGVRQRNHSGSSGGGYGSDSGIGSSSSSGIGVVGSGGGTGTSTSSSSTATTTAATSSQPSSASASSDATTSGGVLSSLAALSSVRLDGYVRVEDQERLGGDSGGSGGGMASVLVDLLVGIRLMPKSMRVVLSVMALTWMAWFPFFLFDTDWMGREVYRGEPSSADPAAVVRYQAGVRDGALGLLLFAVVQAATAFCLDPICIRFGPAIVWAAGNLLLATSLLATWLVTTAANSAAAAAAAAANIADAAAAAAAGAPAPAPAPGVGVGGGGGESVGVGDGAGWQEPSASVRAAALSVFAIAGASFAITGVVPYSITADQTAGSGAGQGLSMGILNLAIVCPQILVSLGAGPWDALFGGGNVPAFVLGALFAISAAVLSAWQLSKLPRSASPGLRRELPVH
ncbi:hypothetical protein CLOM_g22910 [Closterium sp. NIES-68]|nr:hypothetical protein CLOM_g22910 [Closterium sp. NIES-68]